MENFRKTIISALQSWTRKKIKESVHESTADWSQNDLSADSYVKNRTHWEGEELITLVDNLNHIEHGNGNFPGCNFIPGRAYDVIWNGTLYEGLVCWFDGSYNVIATQADYPFYIDDDGGNGLYVTSEDEDWTLTIIEHTTVIHKLDQKYLPETVVTTDEVQDVKQEALDAAQEALDAATDNAARLLTYQEGLCVMPTSDRYWEVVYGGDKFIATVDFNTASDVIAYSTDGLKWYKSSVGESTRGRHTAYGNGVFVTICADTRNSNGYGEFFRSEDGINWSTVYAPRRERWTRIAYGNGRFVALAQSRSNSINTYYSAYSEDGINWNCIKIPFDIINATNMIYDGNNFMLFSNKQCIRSSDGVNWSAHDVQFNYDGDMNGLFLSKLYYENGTYILTTTKDNNLGNYCVTSTDGTTWTVNSIPISNNRTSYITSGNGLFIIYEDSNNYCYSYDGVTWTGATMPPDFTCYAMTYGNGKFIAIGRDNVIYSKDGVTWHHETSALIQDSESVTDEINKLLFTDPVGTGSFSMNRQENSQVGKYSSAMGRNLVANYLCEFVSGQFNNYDKINYVERTMGSVASVSPGASVTYSETYSFDPTTGVFTLDNPKTATYGSVPLNVYIEDRPGVDLVQSKSTSGTFYRVTGTYIYAELTTNVKGTYAHVVGNGTSDTKRSNAYTLDWEGNSWYAGDVYVGSNSGTNKDEGSKKLATEEFVNSTKPYMSLHDEDNGYEYIVKMKNGVLISFCRTSNIELTTLPTTLEYTVGDTFNLEGMIVTAIGQDGSNREITNYTYSEPDMSAAGTATITVSYEETDQVYTATFDITIAEAAAVETTTE